MTEIVITGAAGATTLVTAALDRIARQCAVTPPTSWITATRLDHVEIRDDFFMETIDDILERIDLPSPIAGQVQITGTGAETYDLPADFRRLQRDEMAVYDPQLDRRLVPITNDGEWTYLKDIGTTGIIHYYRLRGFDGNWQIDIYTEPPTGRVIEVHYITNNWMANEAGTVGEALTSETDVLILPRRLVETGTVWRYRERRGLPYQDKYNEYEMLLARLSNDTRGRRKVQFGEPVMNVKWQDKIPSWIPPE